MDAGVLPIRPWSGYIVRRGGDPAGSGLAGSETSNGAPLWLNPQRTISSSKPSSQPRPAAVFEADQGLGVDRAPPGPANPSRAGRPGTHPRHRLIPRVGTISTTRAPLSRVITVDPVAPDRPGGSAAETDQGGEPDVIAAGQVAFDGQVEGVATWWIGGGVGQGVGGQSDPGLGRMEEWEQGLDQDKAARGSGSSGWRRGEHCATTLGALVLTMGPRPGVRPMPG